MENLKLHIDENEHLQIEIDLTRAIEFTKSCRNVKIASTGGNLTLWKDGAPHPFRVKLNLSCFRALLPEEKKQVPKHTRLGW